MAYAKVMEEFVLKQANRAITITNSGHGGDKVGYLSISHAQPPCEGTTKTVVGIPGHIKNLVEGVKVEIKCQGHFPIFAYLSEVSKLFIFEVLVDIVNVAGGLKSSFNKFISPSTHEKKPIFPCLRIDPMKSDTGFFLNLLHGLQYGCQLRLVIYVIVTGHRVMTVFLFKFASIIF